MNKGAYQLVIHISRNIEIKVGALGSCYFQQGDYVYTGSAMKNLRQRIERHIRTNQNHSSKLHWHIDYLLSNKYVKIKDIKIFISDEKIECKLNQALLNNGNTQVPVKNFGSSDCKECPSHLLKLGPAPKLRKV